jgi:hypothetical protein
VARMEHPPEYDDQNGGERTWMTTSIGNVRRPP